MADQLRIGKEVTRKVKKSDDESDEDIPPIPLEKSDNPWLGGTESAHPTSEITSGYRKLWDTVNKNKEIKKIINEIPIKAKSKPKKKKQSVDREVNVSDLSASDDNESITSESPEMQEEFSEELNEGLVRKSTMEDFEQRDEDIEIDQIYRPKKTKSITIEEKVSETTKNKTKLVTDIDPFKFISMPDATIINSSVPVTEEGNEEEDEEEQRRMTLAEAFADDDVIEQFKEEKKRVVSASAPKDIDLTLPGWGEWGGSGVKISKRKRRQFIIKAPPAPKRRDENQGNLIINEDKNTNMRRQQVIASVKSFEYNLTFFKSQVDDLPFPFRSAAAFETTIRAPVTSTFIPETAVRKLAAPKVITKIGTVIAPMTDEVLISTTNRNKESDDKMELENVKKSSQVKDKKRKRSELTATPPNKRKVRKNEWKITDKPAAKSLRK